MKSKLFLASSFFALALLCQPSAHGQLPNATPARPRPETGRPKPTGTVTGGTQNIVNSKLLLYTRNGLGTSYTNTGGEFPSQLSASATVNNEFSLRWSRPTPGKIEKCNLYVMPPNSTAWVGAKSVTMPAQSTSVDIPYLMPNLAPKTYEMKVVCDSGSSSKVTINYTGQGSAGPAIVVTVPTGGASAPAPAAFSVTGAKFTPMIGAPGVPGYKRARLTLTLGANAATTISKIEVKVWSEPWANTELITSSNSKNSPIILFEGKWAAPGGKYNVLPDKENSISITLRRTSGNDVEAQETGPGLYSPGDWGRAFAETTTAVFRWSVDGKLSGSFEKSPKKQWLWP